MKPILEIISYVGAGPIQFGMAESQVENVLGKPEVVRPAYTEGKTAYYEPICVHCSTENKVVGIGFTNDTRVIIDGIDIFEDPDSLRKLAIKDGCPYESYGILAFLNFGISLGGLHDGDVDNRGGIAFVRGHWDKVKNKLNKLPIPN